MEPEDDNSDGLYTYEINVEERLCLVVAKGRIGIKSSIKAIKTVAYDPKFDKDFSVIVDLRYSNYHPSYKEVLQLHKYLVFMKDHFQNKIAVVTTSFLWVVGELISNLSRPFGMNISAFSDMDKARQWISEVS